MNHSHQAHTMKDLSPNISIVKLIVNYLGTLIRQDGRDSSLPLSGNNYNMTQEANTGGL